MRNTRLADKVKIVLCVVPTAGAAAGMTETEVDCTGYTRVMYVLQLGAAGAAGSTVDLKAQHAAATGMGGAADITGAAFAQINGTAGGSKTYVMDIAVNPSYPFQILIGVVGTNTFANSVIAVLYRPTGSTVTYPIATTYATQLVTLDTSVNA